jgi:hypothetical protein
MAFERLALRLPLSVESTHKCMKARGAERDSWRQGPQCHKADKGDLLWRMRMKVS